MPKVVTPVIPARPTITQFLFFNERQKTYELDMMDLDGLLAALRDTLIFVVAVLGVQGIGKSTMLNHIVRCPLFCCLASCRAAALRLTNVLTTQPCSSARTSRRAMKRRPGRRHKACGQRWYCGTGNMS